MNTPKTPDAGADTPKPSEEIIDQSTLAAKQVTAAPTEADLEARIDAAIRHAFPLLPREAIRHQTKFSFWFGGNEITVGGKSKDAAQARADVILYFKDKPLAVLELKRIGLALSDDDSKQGLSYARVMNPMVPLVVVSNGADVKFVETYSGQPWQPTERDEQVLMGLLKSAAQVAAGERKTAVSTLMATNPEIWTQAVRKTTESKIKELSGSWRDRLKPFVEGFHIPRKATLSVKHALLEKKRLIIVEGAPLAGKSNVLHEIALNQENDPLTVVLFIECEGTSSVLLQIADILTQALDWPVSKDEARAWLRHLSLADGPTIVIAINGIGADIDKSREEIVDLSGPLFGNQLALVIELNDTIAEAAILNNSGRGTSAIGRRAHRVQVSRLDDEEFVTACAILHDLRIGFMHGAQRSIELRSPWVLRVIGSSIMHQPKHLNSNVLAIIPPSLSLDLIGLTRSVFSADDRIAFQSIAKATIEDIEDKKRPPSLTLQSMGAYIIRQKTLKKHLSAQELDRLKGVGFIKSILHESNEAIFVVQVPELVVSETSLILATQIGELALKSARKTAVLLETVAANLPFGDLIAAQSLIEAAIQNHGLPYNVITALMEHPPSAKIVKEGTEMLMHLPDLGTVRVTARKDGLTVMAPDGTERAIQFPPDERPGMTYANIHPWLILSHVAGVPFRVIDEGKNNDPLRIDPILLMEVGKCPMPLLRPGADPERNMIITHEIDGLGSIVCHKSGIVEPITLSIFKYLSTEGPAAQQWIQSAVETEAVPLLARLDIALSEMIYLADSVKSDFAQKTLEKLVTPALAKFITPH